MCSVSDHPACTLAPGAIALAFSGSHVRRCDSKQARAHSDLLLTAETWTLRARRSSEQVSRTPSLRFSMQACAMSSCPYWPCRRSLNRSTVLQTWCPCLSSLRVLNGCAVGALRSGHEPEREPLCISGVSRWLAMFAGCRCLPWDVEAAVPAAHAAQREPERSEESSVRARAQSWQGHVGMRGCSDVATEPLPVCGRRHQGCRGAFRILLHWQACSRAYKAAARHWSTSHLWRRGRLLVCIHTRSARRMQS